MAEKKPTKKGTQKSARSTAAIRRASRGFTDEERAAMRERAHELKAAARPGKVVCFFQGAHKFKTRYALLGFSDKATLDEGHMWPTAFALEELTAADEARVGALVKKAVS
jgi:hypothetical protein